MAVADNIAEDHHIDISFVVPLYNEAESLPTLIKEIREAIEDDALRTYLGATPRYEVILINDGSQDASEQVIKSLIKDNSSLRLISFRRNYGKSAALDAGFKEAVGRYVITLDADLQDNPFETLPLIKKLDEGYDLVSGWKKKRFDPISKTIPSKLFNFVTATLSGIPIHDFNCGLKAYRSDVIKTVQVYGEMHRYIPVLAKWNGFRVSEIPVMHRARKYGTTKFGVSRFFYGFLDLLTVLFITSYLKRPMHFFGVIGIICFILGFSLGAYLTIEKFFYDGYLSNRPMLFLAVLLIILGVQFFMGGLLGEMITKSYHRSETYLIKEKVNCVPGS